MSVPVLGADTAVVVDGRILGKPSDAEDAAVLLQKFGINVPGSNP